MKMFAKIKLIIAKILDPLTIFLALVFSEMFAKSRTLLHPFSLKSHSSTNLTPC